MRHSNLVDPVAAAQFIKELFSTSTTPVQHPSACLSVLDKNILNTFHWNDVPKGITREVETFLGTFETKVQEHSDRLSVGTPHLIAGVRISNDLIVACWTPLRPEKSESVVLAYGCHHLLKQGGVPFGTDDVATVALEWSKKNGDHQDTNGTLLALLKPCALRC